MDEEYDPNHDDATFGVSSVFSKPVNDTEAGTIVYAESIRDSPENDPSVSISIPNLKKVTSIHEIGHEFGMTDGLDQGPLMDATALVANTQAKVDALIWNGEGLRLIMLTKQPGHAPHK